jgi:hypothetical protein
MNSKRRKSLIAVLPGPRTYRNKKKVASIHPPSESTNSRKPLFSLTYPYTLGPGKNPE